MQPLRVFSVVPQLPQKLIPLWFLANNYWFSWNDDISELFSSIDPELWRKCKHNPIWLLNRTSQDKLNALENDSLFVEQVYRLVDDLKKYLSAPSRFKLPGIKEDAPAIAYFSLEFGISLCLPIYSGGLGILAGDHLKSASDLNVPLVGIGLAYTQGYFRQYMTPDGWQQEQYPNYDFEQMPLKPAIDPDGLPAKIHLSLAGKPLVAQILQAEIGRVTLYLLDTNIGENTPEFRQITARLYGGNLEMRLWQEILLGIGGVKALRVLGLDPHVVHINEGHSAFAGLERVKELIQKHGLPFEVAVEVAASGSIFTTHTPVPAGNDRFPPNLMQQYFDGYAKNMGLSFQDFMALGREVPSNQNEDFCMTVLALKLSRFNNGVSKLHGKVSRLMWRKIWEKLPVDDIPIGSITNGVHAPTWVAHDMASLFDRYLGDNWREGGNGKIWERVANIPEIELWRTHERLRARLVNFARRRLYAQKSAHGARQTDLALVENILDPEALTIGFARRFATYKRAQLLMQDLDSLRRVITNAQRPVQFIFAGKAHPQDQGGKQLIKDLITLCQTDPFRKNIVFLEDYDMEVAAHLISGCDIWLNNPRRPLEACGTSGMKAMFNGVIQFSTLDGWWDEAWKDDNSLGWAIGKGEEYDDPAYQDSVELHTLYKILESEIIPDFYERQRGDLPARWVKRMKDALCAFGNEFHSHRMVLEYLDTSYIPACESYQSLNHDNFSPARELSAWRNTIISQWNQLVIRDVETTDEHILYVGQEVTVRAKVYLGDIPKDHIRLDIYVGRVDHDNSFASRSLVPMHPEGETQNGWQEFSGKVAASKSGRFGFTVRAMPFHPLLPNSHSLGLVHWAEPDR